MSESLTDLTEKQVVNLCDGRILGYIVDFKIDVGNGRLTDIILPGEGGFLGFKKCTDVVIPWGKICKIGKDTIIVDIGILPAVNEFDVKKGKYKRKL